MKEKEDKKKDREEGKRERSTNRCT